MAVSLRKYFVSYCLGLYVITFLSSNCKYWALDCYEEHANPKEIAVFKSIIFSTAFDVYSFTYLFFWIQTSSNHDERKQEHILHIVAFIFLTIFGLFTFICGSEFLNILMYSSALGFTVSSAMLVLLYNFIALQKISVKLLKGCA